MAVAITTDLAGVRSQRADALVAPRVRSHAIKRIAIVGGGPAGAMLGHELAREGYAVGLFAPDSRPPLLVGESLVPAVVPFLQRLGIEDEVASYSVLKPGATFTLRGHGALVFEFKDFKRVASPYAYNCPRDRLDASILHAAARQGVRVFPFAAKVERSGDDRVCLSEETLRATDGYFAKGPDWIVDATGRRRLLSGLLQLPSQAGPRQDTALFAHLEGMPVASPGHTHTDLLEHGWSWRIPLPGRTSLGLVLPGDAVARYGGSSEETYDRCVAQDPHIRSFGGAPRRVTPVMRYNNYQMLTQRGFGDGWALTGDAFGFVDPVFSSGLMVSLDSAARLAKALLIGTPTALRAYEQHVLRHVGAWHRAVDRFYDGRLLTLFQVGFEARQRVIGRLLNVHFSRHFPQLFTGDATLRRYSSWLLQYMCKHGLMRKDPELLRVRA